MSSGHELVGEGFVVGIAVSVLYEGHVLSVVGHGVGDSFVCEGLLLSQRHREPDIGE
jgi:hypothetical protein